MNTNLETRPAEGSVKSAQMAIDRLFLALSEEKRCECKGDYAEAIGTLGLLAHLAAVLNRNRQVGGALMPTPRDQRVRVSNYLLDKWQGDEAWGEGSAVDLAIRLLDRYHFEIHG